MHFFQHTLLAAIIFIVACASFALGQYDPQFLPECEIICLGPHYTPHCLALLDNKNTTILTRYSPDPNKIIFSGSGHYKTAKLTSELWYEVVYRPKDEAVRFTAKGPTEGNFFFTLQWQDVGLVNYKVPAYRPCSHKYPAGNAILGNAFGLYDPDLK